MTGSELRPAVFLDLNGTLVLPVKPTALSDYAPIDGAVDPVAALCRVGFVCPVITVQSKIGKGLFPEAEFRDWFQSFRTELAAGQAFVQGPYVCPHRYSEQCGCKKPGGALYRQAARELRLDLVRSFVVGDSLEDMEAAQVIGCQGVLVQTGWPSSTDLMRRSRHVASTVLDASRWIVATAQAAQQAATPRGRANVSGSAWPGRQAGRSATSERTKRFVAHGPDCVPDGSTDSRRG